MVAPSVAGDPVVAEWWSTYLRLGATPRIGMELLRMNAEIDVRPILPAVRAPSLVLHREGDRAFPVESGRYLAEHIPGARLRVLPGEDHQFWAGDSDVLADEIEVLTGTRGAARSDRILATLLLTDIVDSTRQLPSSATPPGRAPRDPRPIVRDTLNASGVSSRHDRHGFRQFDPARPGRPRHFRRPVPSTASGLRSGSASTRASGAGGWRRAWDRHHLAARSWLWPAPVRSMSTRTVRDLVADPDHVRRPGLARAEGDPR
jgi:hypothetical protein